VRLLPPQRRAPVHDGSPPRGPSPWYAADMTDSPFPTTGISSTGVPTYTAPAVATRVPVVAELIGSSTPGPA